MVSNARRGGPFDHRLINDMCRVCGYQPVTGEDTGCPMQVHLTSRELATPGQQLTSAREFEAAMRDHWQVRREEETP